MTTEVQDRATPSVLVITSQFGVPWEPTRGIFNQQQFARLADSVSLTVLVVVPWREALRHRLALRRSNAGASRPQVRGELRVRYTPFWYPPGLWRGAHAACLLLSLLLHCPRLVLGARWSCILGSWAYPDAVAAAWLAWLRQTPAVMKVHGTDINDYLSEPAKRRQILWAARSCRAVVGVGRGLLDRLESAGLPPDRLHWIRHGVDSTRFLPAPRQAARMQLASLAAGAMPALPAKAKLLLFVGRLHPVKNCAGLVEAFCSLAASRPHWHLALVGDGPQRDVLSRLAQSSGLFGRVHLVGRVDHNHLPTWYAASDLVCLPSQNEGLPNVVLEALACGRPVVASAVGDLPAILPGFAGILTPVGDLVALRMAISEAIESPPDGGWDSQRIAAYGQRFGWGEGVDALRTLLLIPQDAIAPAAGAPAAAMGDGSPASAPGTCRASVEARP